jgi:ADP-heptose:LPS heptosyltransferase
VITDEPRRVPDVSRIAVLRANGIGDFLMILPALQAVRRAYPAAQITLLGAEWLPSFLHGRPGPWHEVVVAPPFPGLPGRPTGDRTGDDLGRFLDRHAGRYDIVLQLHGGGRTSNPFVKRLRPRVSAGACAADAEPLDRCIPYADARHEILRWLEVVRMVGATGPDDVLGLRPVLTVTDRDVEEASAAPSDRPLIALHVGARDPRRCWLPERFAELGTRLAEELNAHLVLVGGPDDVQASAQVRRLCSAPVLDLSGQLSLGGTLGVLKRSALSVGNDSGVRHLASAVEIPTLGFFWIGNVASFGPLVGTSDETLVACRVTCPVCGKRQIEDRCPHNASFLDEITVDAAYDKARSLLGRMDPI